MIVRRGAVKFEVVEGQAGEIKRFQVEACRDHFCKLVLHLLFIFY